MSRYYHPSTKEHIPNPLPRVTEWAGEAATEAPTYDRDTETCHYIDGAWVVETIVPEVTRDDLKSQRDLALQAIVHDFGDGRVVQVRPQDVSNLQMAIQLGTNQEWVMADNTVATLTPTEMQTALDSGVMQGKQIWQTYIDNIKAL